MATADENLENWFQYLERMRETAGALSLDTAPDLILFARQAVADLLTTDIAKATFEKQVASSTGLVVTDTTLGKATTFLDLMNIAAPSLSDYVLMVFIAVAPAPYNFEHSGDFKKEIASKVFSTAALTKVVTDHLQKDMPAGWLTAEVQNQLSKAFASADHTVLQAVMIVAAI